MKLLTNIPVPTFFEPDGERLDRRDDGKPCLACRYSLSSPDRTGPFTWLQGHVYCEVCYPKMVAVLEADAKLVALQAPVVHHPQVESLQNYRCHDCGAYEGDFHNPLCSLVIENSAASGHIPASNQWIDGIGYKRAKDEKAPRSVTEPLPGDMFIGRDSSGKPMIATVPRGQTKDAVMVDDCQVAAHLLLPNPILCPASGCNAVLGSTDGTRFEPDDQDYVVEKDEQPNGLTVYSLRCRCGRERKWPG